MAFALLVGAASLWLGVEIVSNTAADVLAADYPEAALSWQGNHPAALASLARRDLAERGSAANPDAARRFAQRALRGDPLEAQALSLLALAAEADADMRRAASLMQLAGARSRRDTRVQAWLLDRRMSAKEYAAALTHADAILRVRPDAQDALLPVLTAFADDPEGRALLTPLLAGSPPWRSWFMARLPGESERPTALYDLYAALDSEGAPLAAEEFRPYLERLIEADEHALAYAMQVDFLPEERIAMLGLLNNGGFEFPVSGLPFDWTIGSLRGARTQIVLEDSDRVLRVELFGGRGPFRHVWQHLLLQPGEYRLRGEVASAGLVNERGMLWVIACAEAPREVLLATERVSGTRPWTPFDATFTVPDGETCRAQEIRLILAARSPAEEEAEGEIRYDDLRIERVERPPGYAPPDRGDGDD